MPVVGIGEGAAGHGLTLEQVSDDLMSLGVTRKRESDPQLHLRLRPLVRPAPVASGGADRPRVHGRRRSRRSGRVDHQGGRLRHRTVRHLGRDRPECKAGETRFCRNGMFWGTNGYDAGQGEKVRLPFADGTLVVVPAGDDLDDHMLKALLPLTDVLSTGHHAALDGRVSKASTVAVIGDWAVGLCAVAASKRLGASGIFLVSTHEDRAKIGTQFGATTSSTRAARTLSSKSRKPPTISVSTPPSNASEPPKPGPLPSTLSGSVATSASSASPTTSPTSRYRSCSAQTRASRAAAHRRGTTSPNSWSTSSTEAWTYPPSSPRNSRSRTSPRAIKTWTSAAPSKFCSGHDRLLRNRAVQLGAPCSRCGLTAW